MRPGSGSMRFRAAMNSIPLFLQSIMRAVRDSRLRMKRGADREAEGTGEHKDCRIPVLYHVSGHGYGGGQNRRGT